MEVFSLRLGNYRFYFSCREVSNEFIMQFVFQSSFCAG
jgi:hypothetical protein